MSRPNMIGLFLLCVWAVFILWITFPDGKHESFATKCREAGGIPDFTVCLNPASVIRLEK